MTGAGGGVRCGIAVERAEISENWPALLINSERPGISS